MKFGVQVNVYRTSWDAVRKSVLKMEAGPWDSVWLADHFIPPGATKEQEALTAPGEALPATSQERNEGAGNGQQEER